MSEPSQAVDRGTGAEAELAYQTLLQCRELDLTLHVERSNLCLVIQGALFAFAAPALLEATTPAGGIVGLLICAFGLGVSALSIVVVGGADFWISYWEHRLGEVEAHVLPSVQIFRNHPSQRNQSRVKELATRNLVYVSSRTAVRGLFWFIAVVWGALLVIVSRDLISKVIPMG